MPPTTSKPAPKRKPPSFKPPRPAKSTKQPPAPRRKSAPPKSKRPSFLADEASASSSPEEDNDDDDDDNDDDAMPIDVPSSSNPSEPSEMPTSTQDPPQTIPPALLSRLLHHHFKGEKIRIGKEAEGVVGKYMETFVREAIARAAFERAESEKEGGAGAGGWSGGFLEVEDLEKLAPQLILDF